MNVTLSLMELSPDLRFAGVAGELLTGMGMKLKGIFREGVTLPLSYSNGNSSYIPDSSIIKEGGYEGLEAVFFSLEMSAPWREDIDETFLSAFEELRTSLR